MLKPIQLLQDAFQRFSVVFGIQANIEKSSIFMFEVKSKLNKAILTTMSYIGGEISFRYLRVPLTSKKLTIVGIYHL